MTNAARCGSCGGRKSSVKNAGQICSNCVREVNRIELAKSVHQTQLDSVQVFNT